MGDYNTIGPYNHLKASKILLKKYMFENPSNYIGSFTQQSSYKLVYI